MENKLEKGLTFNRKIKAEKEFNLKDFFLQWEWLLLLIFIAIHIMNSQLSPYYLNTYTLLDATMTFLDKAFIALSMTFVIIFGDIDISVGSTVALSSVIMAVLYNAGLSMPLAIIVCLLVGITAGFINGILIVKFKELSAVIVTLSTMILYRGIAYIILEDQAAGGFPMWFNFLGWGYIKNLIPVILIAFSVAAVIFYLLLHKTTFGRKIYAIGNNDIASLFSGVKVDKIKLIVFTLNGFMAALAALFLTSKMGSTRPNIASGYELDVIAMVVLGGVSTSGGKGRMIGVLLSIFIIGYLRYGLGLVNVPSQVILIIIGALLIISVLVSNLLYGNKSE
ncbi:monosaccharide ABC transporter membrane protein (CUT2 family) [Halanaerobium saccharolyticum]|uniref:Autoinducer 2 import system permease protein LsrD n=1 Tax=Halanaerobium saccharolyticum TaxID=43595 RepID=A0A4V3G4K1_9FIRM|nr:ABC transporter permease [Halanaerobium saccharolyticum]RAK06336.1 monosaccharide ABC transporter membrane protein (CUT2 family) [Halanaerobium saccharolyticum]TDW00648.1 monosaccharide ABC transporter membrane protein (CUT2 family) [Halanaerobium saccharolyticum]TDX52261.1 monosaccharide ABC transporter membrane protein (CUT2 family) [Halanaerobium saccharolyticum]